MSDNQNPNAAPDPAAEAVPALTVQLYLVIPLFFGLLILFCIIRNIFPLIYSPRVKLSRARPPPLSKNYLKWIWELVQIDDETVFQKAGMDGYAVVRIFRLATMYFGFTALLNLIIILPLHATAEREEGFAPKTDLFTIDLLPEGSPRFAAHATLAWLFHGTFMYFLYKEFWSLAKLKYSRYFPEIILEQPANWTAIFITQIPSELRSHQALKGLFERLGFPAKRVSFTTWSHEVTHILEKRQENLEKLEKLVDKFAGNPVENSRHMEAITTLKSILARTRDRDTGDVLEHRGNVFMEDKIRGLFTSSNADMITMGNQRQSSILDVSAVKGAIQNSFDTISDELLVTLEEFMSQDNLLREARRRELEIPDNPSDLPQNAFVTFEDVRSGFIVSQTIVDSQPGQMLTELVSEPADVYWPNVFFGAKQKTIRNLIVNVVFVAMTFAYVFPVGAVSLLLKLDELERVGAISFFLNLSPAIRAIIEGILPTLALNIFFAIVPFLVTLMAKQRGNITYSGIENEVLAKLSTFFLFTLFLSGTFFGTVATLIPDMIARGLSGSASFIVEEIIKSFQTALPNAAPFFVNYVCYNGTVSFMVENLRLVPLIFYILRKFRILSGSPRAFNEQTYPPPYLYGYFLAEPIIVFVISQTYVLLTPFMSVFAFIYFGMAMLGNKYKLLYVFRNRFDQGGNLFVTFFHYSMLGMLLNQILMIVVLGVYKAPGPSTSYIPLAIVTVILWIVGARIIGSRMTTIPLRNLAKQVGSSGHMAITIDGRPRIEKPNEPSGQRLLGRDSDDDSETGHARLKSARSLLDPDFKPSSLAEKELTVMGDHTDRQPPMDKAVAGILEDDWWVRSEKNQLVWKHPILVGSLPSVWLATDNVDLASASASRNVNESTS